MPIVKCGVCNKSFYVKQCYQKLGWGKYCSISCRSKSQLKGMDVICDVCGKKVHRSPYQIVHSKSGNFFCTKKCQTLWRNRYFIGEKHANWISGESCYREILKRGGTKQMCKLCGIENKMVLTVHHIDHNRQNNDSLNLTWLCYNCHHLVHHNRKVEKSLQRT
jgi:hypothetical protein